MDQRLANQLRNRLTINTAKTPTILQRPAFESESLTSIPDPATREIARVINNRLPSLTIRRCHAANCGDGPGSCQSVNGMTLARKRRTAWRLTMSKVARRRAGTGQTCGRHWKSIPFRDSLPGRRELRLRLDNCPTIRQWQRQSRLCSIIGRSCLESEQV